MSARIRMGAWEPHRDDVKSNGCSVQDSRYAHTLPEQGGTLTEDVQLGRSKRVVEQSLDVREFVGDCGVDSVSPLVLL